jgi:CRISPR system Cascade subunit CasE
MSALHLIRLPISLAALGRWAAERRIGWISRKGPGGAERDGGLDEGRALHHLLAETFGKGILQPFRLMPAPKGGGAFVYAYTGADGETLAETARACALPEVLGVLALDRLEAKAMPSAWQAGRRLGFEVRVRPVIRLAESLPGGSATATAFGKGAEVDAFLAEAMRRFPAGPEAEQSMLVLGRGREAVYGDWLAARLGEAVRPVAPFGLATFQRRPVQRQGRAALDGPDALLRGEVEIMDGHAFASLLAKGVGRHRAYGYGMLLIRPPGRAG